MWFVWYGPVWARGRCRISPARFLAECCKRQLNQVNFVLLYFRLSTFSDLYWVYLSAFSCTVLFVSISQVIGCEDRLRNDLYCDEWGVKLYSNQSGDMLADIHTDTCATLVSQSVSQFIVIRQLEGWGPIYKISYDYHTIMPKLRSTYDGRLIYKTSCEGRKAFLRYDSLAKL